MTTVLVFQMERSNFSVLILGTALPLLVFNPHHPSHTEAPGIPMSLNLIVTACPNGCAL